ncbi:MAG TPA: hypothetical protein VGN00_12245 [Puia sp.]
MNPKQLLSFLILLCTHRDAISQPLSDSEAVQSYTTSPASRDKLYNGPLYSGYDHHPQGHPFFISDTLLTGSISYDGILFPGVRLSYDLTKDAVIMKNVQKDINFQLLPEKLPYFTIAHHRFVYLTSDSTAVDLPSTGFYEELYHGKAIALARHEKVIQYIGRAEENLTHYRQYDFYHLQVRGRYYSIHSERNMLDAFGPDKTLIRDFVKRSRLSFRKDPVATLAKTAEYYSKLDN